MTYCGSKTVKFLEATSRTVDAQGRGVGGWGGREWADTGAGV